MSTELDHAREMAERIARRVSGTAGAPAGHTQPRGEVSAELAAVRAGLSELQRKSAAQSLSNTPSGPPSTHSPWLAGINSSYSHPSQEKFGVEEATVTELVDFFEKEKQCTLEAGDKPCDHCAMCSSRGF